MAIPIYLQQFKAAGVYRVVFDKSTVSNIDTQIMRLVVGYSEKGPFNIPVYVRDQAQFKAYFGEPSKKLEKRGVYFHRLALQMLQTAPILCLNLKKFDGETVDGSTISTQFNPKVDPIDTIHLNVEDIYNTVRFWELDADKLNNLRGTNGTLDEYINISATNIKSTSNTYFIRKASGTKVSSYNITVNDWYSDNQQEMPEYLEGLENNLISDFFAEIYIFKGKFTAKQVLASDTLKNYFVVTSEVDENDEPVLMLRQSVKDAFGDSIDTLDALYQDGTSNAIGHWIGCLIPEFKNKQGAYASLDVLFNNDEQDHNMMMSFNRDLLDESDGKTNIDLSGRLAIPTNEAVNTNKVKSTLSLQKIYLGTAKTNLLGNMNAPVIADKITFGVNVYDATTGEAIIPLSSNDKNKIIGTLYVAKVDAGSEGEGVAVKTAYSFTPYVLNTDEETKDTKKYLDTAGEATDSTDDAAVGSTVILDTYPTDESAYMYVETADADKYAEYLKDKYTVDDSGNAIAATAGSAIYKLGYQLTLVQVHNHSDVNDTDDDVVVITLDTKRELYNLAAKLGVLVKSYYADTDDEVVAGDYYEGDVKELKLEEGYGTYWSDADAFNDATDPLAGPEKIITTISRIEGGYSDEDDVKIFTDIDDNLKVNFMDVEVVTSVKYINEGNVGENSVYGSSVSFIDYMDDNWVDGSDEKINGSTGNPAFICKNYYDRTLMAVLHEGDCLLADDGSALDINGDDEVNESDKDNYYDNVYVQEIGTQYYEDTDDEVIAGSKEAGDFKFYYILFTSLPLTRIATSSDYVSDEDKPNLDMQNAYVVRIDGSLNQEIGQMVPRYLEGYSYKHSRPANTGMYSKVEWQNFILSALTDYKGLRTALLNKSEVDYRYVIDTFESYPVTGLKDVLSYLCKEKQSAFCIANFPSVKTFIKCPYTSFTDAKGVFDVNYVVTGYNKKKAASMKFSLPTDSDGASFIAFYTPLKFSDGYIDSIIPSAGLVSNLFINKYMSRQPYYIVAGPNYGSINASGLVGPDYHYSQDELQLIEPFGVNVMVYRPSFGTFINANQTAKQTPVSALSKVNVRELVIYLQDEIEKVLQAYQWEFNNTTTRNAIKDKADQICELVLANGGIQAYKNIMDETNNTAEIIDNEMAVLSTHIEPGMGCGKMVQELTLYRTGQMSASITE